MIVHWASSALPMAVIYRENPVEFLIRALLPDGYRATQHALLCDVALRAIDRRRHGNQEHPMALFGARLKETSGPGVMNVVEPSGSTTAHGIAAAHGVTAPPHPEMPDSPQTFSHARRRLSRTRRHPRRHRTAKAASALYAAFSRCSAAFRAAAPGSRPMVRLLPPPEAGEGHWALTRSKMC